MTRVESKSRKGRCRRKSIPVEESMRPMGQLRVDDDGEVDRSKAVDDVRGRARRGRRRGSEVEKRRIDTAGGRCRAMCRQVGEKVSDVGLITLSRKWRRDTDGGNDRCMAPYSPRHLGPDSMWSGTFYPLRLTAFYITLGARGPGNQWKHFGHISGCG
jgi:hypothetical protein